MDTPNKEPPLLPHSLKWSARVDSDKYSPSPVEYPARFEAALFRGEQKIAEFATLEWCKIIAKLMNKLTTLEIEHHGGNHHPTGGSEYVRQEYNPDT
jgi:hypothetical protein